MEIKIKKTKLEKANYNTIRGTNKWFRKFFKENQDFVEKIINIKNLDDENLVKKQVISLCGLLYETNEKETVYAIKGYEYYDCLNLPFVTLREKNDDVTYFCNTTFVTDNHKITTKSGEIYYFYCGESVMHMINNFKKLYEANKKRLK